MAAIDEKLPMIFSNFSYQLIKQVFVFWIPKFGSFGVTQWALVKVLNRPVSYIEAGDNGRHLQIIVGHGCTKLDLAWL